jgi:hypothetical protein
MAGSAFSYEEIVVRLARYQDEFERRRDKRAKAFDS